MFGAAFSLCQPKTENWLFSVELKLNPVVVSKTNCAAIENVRKRAFISSMRVEMLIRNNNLARLFYETANSVDEWRAGLGL